MKKNIVKEKYINIYYSNCPLKVFRFGQILRALFKKFPVEATLQFTISRFSNDGQRRAPSTSLKNFRGLFLILLTNKKKMNNKSQNNILKFLLLTNDKIRVFNEMHSESEHISSICLLLKSSSVIDFKSFIYKGISVIYILKNIVIIFHTPLMNFGKFSLLSFIYTNKPIKQKKS